LLLWTCLLNRIKEGLHWLVNYEHPESAEFDRV